MADDAPSLLPPGVTADMRIVLFDGVCVLCNSLAHFVARRESRGLLRMASLQSETGRALLRYAGRPEDDLNTMVFFDRGCVYVRSSAALRVAGYLRFPWWLSGVFRIVPSFIRDWFYWRVANNRYRWFGRHDVCQLPDPALRERFLPE